MAKKQKTKVWKAVVGYEGLYEVSNFGLVRRRISDKELQCARL